MATENQSSSECIASPVGSISDHISLTSSKDLINANCCAAGTPLPFVSWQFCAADFASCSALTNATQSSAELTVTGGDLPEGNGSVRCLAKYLDVAEVVRAIWLHVEKLDDHGKTQWYYKPRRKLRLLRAMSATTR